MKVNSIGSHLESWLDTRRENEPSVVKKARADRCPLETKVTERKVPQGRETEGEEPFRN